MLENSWLTVKRAVDTGQNLEFPTSVDTETGDVETSSASGATGFKFVLTLGTLDASSLGYTGRMLNPR